jgi:hypothetical protein
MVITIVLLYVVVRSLVFVSYDTVSWSRSIVTLSSLDTDLDIVYMSLSSALLVVCLYCWRVDLWMFYQDKSYKPMSAASIRTMVELIRATLPVQDQALDWVDLGCGHGDVLARLRDLPFRRLIGIELDDLVYRYASRRFRGDTRVHIVHGDLFDYVHERSAPVPVYFLYEPLWRSTLSPSMIRRKYLGLLERICREPCFVIYVSAVFARQLPSDMFRHMCGELLVTSFVRNLSCLTRNPLEIWSFGSTSVRQ